MERWLKDNTVLDELQLCTPGTIWVLRQGKGLIHTAVFVGPGVLWHKRGCSGHWNLYLSKSVERSTSKLTTSNIDYLDPETIKH